MLINDLNIEWDTGNMVVHMDNFFPCGLKRFKKLLKIIKLDWQHENELKETLKVYFQDRIADLAELWEMNAKRYCDNNRRRVDTAHMVESGKYPNGIPLSKDDLKQAEKRLREYKKAEKDALLDVNQSLKQRELFKKYLQLI